MGGRNHELALAALGHAQGAVLAALGSDGVDGSSGAAGAIADASALACAQRLGLDPDASLALETSASIAGRIGPLSAVVERLGALVNVGFSSGTDKALGPLDLSLGFKPPNGVGLAVDASIVRGGGYLYLDHEKGEYAGVLELVFAGFLALKAVGIISTRLPDGSKNSARPTSA